MNSLAIIGGGFSGSMLAANLLRLSNSPAEIWLIEKSGSFAAGAAYSTTFDGHLLNVPALRMSAWPDAPEDFLSFLRSRRPGTLADAFASRGDYHEYLAATLNACEGRKSTDANLHRLQDEVHNLHLNAGRKVELQMQSGKNLSVDHVVIATGNESPADPPFPQLAQSNRYLANPWKLDHFDRIAPDDTIFLLGTGLTMLDVVLYLHHRKHRGPIIAASRHGLLPQPHFAKPLDRPSVHLSNAWKTPHQTAASLLKTLHNEIASTRSPDQDWRDTIDALRPITPALWQNLSARAKAQFIRHLRPYWDTHRHRAPVQAVEILHRAIHEKRCRILAARIADARFDSTGIDLHLHPRGQANPIELHAHYLINCTGPRRSIAKSQNTLLRSLYKKGFIRPDPHDLGPDCDQHGAPFDRNGKPLSWMHMIGPLRIPQLWESVAVPELRVQARDLALSLSRM